MNSIAFLMVANVIGLALVLWLWKTRPHHMTRKTSIFALAVIGLGLLVLISASSTHDRVVVVLWALLGGLAYLLYLQAPHFSLGNRLGSALERRLNRPGPLQKLNVASQDVVPHSTNLRQLANAHGKGATMTLFDDRILICWSGPISLLTGRWRRQKEISLTSIRSVHFRSAVPRAAGYISVMLDGEEDPVRLSFEALVADKTVYFSTSQQADFEEFRDRIPGIQKHPQTP